eukprot:m.276494 g.276494  ORF g.276494 m.276494 type:complete len:53 (-) comp22865_c9_seq3:22-180(-)
MPAPSSCPGLAAEALFCFCFVFFFFYNTQISDWKQSNRAMKVDGIRASMKNM